MNTLGKTEYAVKMWVFPLVTLSWYRGAIFSAIPALGYRCSLILLIALTMLAASMGYLLTWNTFRNGLSIFLVSVVAPGTYHLLEHNFSKGVLGIMMLVSIVVTAIVLQCVKKKTTDQIPCCWILCMTAAIMLTIPMVDTVLGFIADDIFWDDNADAKSVCSIEDQLQTLSMLEADQWTRLSQSEQQAVLQTIADIETGRLGIPDVSIRIEDLRTGSRGHYAHSIRTVSINSDYIQNPDVAKTVLHEVYHAFQFSLVEAYEAVPPEYKSLQIFESARTYRFELSNYIDAYLNYDQYVKQQCEQDCRDYSQDRWADYIRILSW